MSQPHVDSLDTELMWRMLESAHVQFIRRAVPQGRAGRPVKTIVRPALGLFASLGFVLGIALPSVAILAVRAAGAEPSAGGPVLRDNLARHSGIRSHPSASPAVHSSTPSSTNHS